MAKKRKPSEKDATPDSAEVNNDTVVEALQDEVADAVETVEDTAQDTTEEVVETLEDAIDSAEPVAEDPAPEPEPEIIEPTPEPQPVPVQHVDSASNSVLLPAILGGIIAAVIGFGVAYYIIPRADPNLSAKVAANETTLGAVEAQVAELAAIDHTTDLTPVTDDIAALSEQVTSSVTDLTTRIDGFEERLVTLEKQPSGDGTLQEAALAAYQNELDSLRAQVEDQASAAFDQLESTREEAAAIEKAALDAARAAKVRGVLAQIQTALGTGAPMETALTELGEVLEAPVPEGLTAVAGGAPTLAKLQADFPNAARNALANARAGGDSGEETSAFGAFLREQLNVRSVAPRDGDDADAVLSRAQAAVSEGQLQTALDEIASLPDVAAAALSEWAALAQARLDAVNAADEISLSLNDN